ncbi:S8 family serine peptidase [Lentilactobacillus sp. Marseille-Q4993]|uniref:S8 family serine peptidase n=1 Tax=Lentilactobacillus sp. Marseille-Q4993 TaxID=3039492 RepID=UPI0024BC91E4|nr:S8 family serine peptidase [Lentilactobacillus sp. Marseille-Q4993]
MRKNGYNSDTKVHYKMYKSGRNWVTATIATLATGIGLVAGFTLSQPAVHADTQTVVSPFASSTKTLAAADDKQKSNDPKNLDALNKGNVQGLWSQGYNGKGMVVAVIDSGVQSHKDFRLSNDADAKISKEDAEKAIAKKGYGKYISSKIPFAYDYVNNDNDTSEPDDQSSFHGQHVAGIMAANGQADGKGSDYVKGVAPEAQILDMRIFGGFADENPNNISRAIRDAVDLGANVINMSLGIGVASQSLTDEEQAAVKYATDHGVFVSIAASNDGNAGSIVSQDGSYSPGGIQTAYDPANNSTIADPGVSATAATVAAENTLTGADDDMASFSSWGPTPDYTLKPDVTAPGLNIWSTWQDNTYQSDSGTSMASPFLGGSATLVLEKLQKERPELKGAALVSAAKNALMNSADPMNDPAYKGSVISPRRQGAGKVNVTEAGDLTGAAVDSSTGIASVSLKQVGNSKDFEVAVTNNGKSAATYDVDSGTTFTQTSDKDNANTLYDTPLKGAAVTADQKQVTLNPGETKKVKFNLKIDDTVKKNSVAEGFLTFKNADSKQNLTVPYLAYYGDLTDEDVVDKPANDKDSVFGGGYLVDEKNNVLGISDPASLSNLVNGSDGSVTWNNVGKKIVNDKVSFSPNSDGTSDTVSPYVFTKQNLKDVTAEVVDSSGKVVRVVNKETNLAKSYYQDGNSWNQYLTLSPSMRLDPTKFKWDGTVYDQSKGKYTVAKDGQYSYRFVTTNYNDGSKKVQNYDLPVKVDNTKPEFDASFSGDTLTVKYSDTGAGFSADSNAIATIGGKEAGVPLKNDGKATSGSADYKLTEDQLKALKASNGKITVTVTDIAGNKTIKTIQAVAGGSDATDTAKPASASPQFKWVRIGDKKSDINGQIRDDIETGKHYWEVVTSDTGKQTFTAQVPKNLEGLKVYASDLRNGVTYAGKVDSAKGTATFEINIPEGGYAQLSGYATIGGSKFGEFKQSGTDGLIVFNDSDSTKYKAIKDDVVKADNPLADEATAAKQVTDVNGAPTLDGHSIAKLTTRFDPTPGITFNGLNDNNTTLLGADSKLYDAKTGQLTISGKVDDPKDKLMILKTPNESDAGNQVKINSDGTFSFQVPFKATEQRGVGYKLTTADGKTSRGTLEIALDTQFPSLNLPDASLFKVDAKTGEYEVETTNSTFTVSGSADDNTDGWRLYSNGDNVYHEQNNSGFNNHDDATKDANPYPAYKFSQTYDLALGDNYFTLNAVDKTGNTVTKKFHVVRKAAPATTTTSTSSTGSSYFVGVTPVQAPTEKPSITSSSDNSKDSSKQTADSKDTSTKYYSGDDASSKTWVVTSSNGVYSYTNKKFSDGKRSAHFKKGTVLSVKDVVKVGDSYRLQLTNGKYVTALKSSVKPSKASSKYHTTVAKNGKVTTKRAVYAYSKAKFGDAKRVKRYKAGATLKVKAVVKSGNSYRFQLTNGTYVTASKSFLKNAK